MRDACGSAVALDAAGPEATRISGLYLGAVIVVSCAVGLTPLELFLVEIWPRHGFGSLLLVILPIIAALGLAGLLPEGYFRIKRAEASGRLYQWLGIRYFKRVVPNGDWVNRRIRQADPGYRVVRDEASLTRLGSLTRMAEQCHLVSLLLVLPAAAYALMLGWEGFALWLVLPNVPLHLYPVFLQRYTRARIEKLRVHRRRAA